MKKLLPLLCIPLALSACTPVGTSIQRENENPYAASRYGDELADAMANIIIRDEPDAKDPAKRAIVDREIDKAKQLGNDARSIIARGMKGRMIAVKEEPEGEALYVDDMLYLSTDFFTRPGPNLHVYLTTAVDPRDVTFPDEPALDLGVLQKTFGPQSYSVPKQDKPELYRTFVLYDLDLKRIYGFAQLSK